MKNGGMREVILTSGAQSVFTLTSHLTNHNLANQSSTNQTN